MTDQPETTAQPGEQREMSVDDAMDAWRHDLGTLTGEQLNALIDVGRWFHHNDRGIYFRITHVPPIDERHDNQMTWVHMTDHHGDHNRYRPNHLKSCLTTGQIDPVSQAVIENTEEIVLGVARYELGQLDTLDRSSRYNILEHTETYGDTFDAVRLAELGIPDTQE